MVGKSLNDQIMRMTRYTFYKSTGQHFIYLLLSLLLNKVY